MVFDPRGAAAPGKVNPVGVAPEPLNMAFIPPGPKIPCANGLSGPEENKLLAAVNGALSPLPKPDTNPVPLTAPPIPCPRAPIP